MKQSKKLSLEPYKGTRDFYPKDQFVQNYIFGVWRKVAEKYGYQEYNSSILEETGLYRAKTGEEIVNEQTYSFTDRGGRDVTIRPEMTPTVARMVAAKRKELTFPLRWFSIPNIWRYERPQRGRLREHWQLNCDIFGVDGIEADVEIIALAYDIMKEFGAKDKDFEIRIDHRKFTDFFLKTYFQGSTPETYQGLRRLLDRWSKLEKDERVKQLREIVNNESIATTFIDFLSMKEIEQVKEKFKNAQGMEELEQLFIRLKNFGINNIRFDASIVRGFDYYTGLVFEMYDVNPKNPRALFGGGRYDDLVSIFGVEKVSGVGFGWGDVTTKDFLETYGLLPQYQSPVDLYIGHTDENYLEAANQLASALRKQGVNVEVDLTERKVAAQVKTADRENIPYIIVIGEEEAKVKKYRLKNLATGKESVVAEKDIHQILKKDV